MWNCKSFYQVVCFIQLCEAGVLSVSLKEDKMRYRAVIKLFVKEGFTPNESHSSIPSFQVLLGRPIFSPSGLQWIILYTLILYRYLSSSYCNRDHLSNISCSYFIFALCFFTVPLSLLFLQFTNILPVKIFIFYCPLLSLRSSSSFLRLLPRLPVTSVPPSIFPSITISRRQFLHKNVTNPVHLPFTYFM
jgi:hypothetical protein